MTYGAGIATEEHNSLSDCTNFYQFYVCGQAQYAKDYDAACHTAVSASSCMNTSKGSALAMPTECTSK